MFHQEDLQQTDLFINTSSCLSEQYILNFVCLGLPFCIGLSPFVHLSPPPYDTEIPFLASVGSKRATVLVSVLPRISQVSVGCFSTSKTSLTAMFWLCYIVLLFTFFIMIHSESKIIYH